MAVDSRLIMQGEYSGKPIRYWIVTFSGELCRFSGQSIVANYLGISRHTVEVAAKQAIALGEDQFEVETGLGMRTVFLYEPVGYAPAPTWRPTQPPVKRDKSKPLLVEPLVVGFAMWNVEGARTEDDYGKRNHNRFTYAK